MATDAALKYTGESPIAVRRWKACVGDLVSQGSVLFLYVHAGDADDVSGSDGELKFRCDRVGTLERIVAAAGTCVAPSGDVAVISACRHPTVMKDLCAECGADLRHVGSGGGGGGVEGVAYDDSASVAMLHSIPELRVSRRQADALGRQDVARLLRHRRLALLVDLDQTLVHTTNDDVPPRLADVFHFQLYGANSPWYHTRLRPGTRQFLQRIARYFELHICTFGVRLYAHTVARFLDPEGVYFSQRILSRDECFSAHSKTANLKALFPCGEHMVCIIDDREDVWNFAPNLVHVKPYHFFRHTGDINAPPGLGKAENDEKLGVDLDQLVRQQESASSAVGGDCAESHPTDSAGIGEEHNREVQRRDSMPNLSDDEEEVASIDGTEGGREKEGVADEFVSCENKRPGNIDELNADLSLSEEEDEENEEKKVESREEMNPPESTPRSCEKDSECINDKKQPSGETAESEPDKRPESTQPNTQTKTEQTSTDDSSTPLQVADTDDYLLHLEDILIRIHTVFYGMLDKSRQAGADSNTASDSEPPDLRLVVPYVRKKVLRGVRLVFSGVVPTNTDLNTSRAFHVATALGATVQERIVRRGSRDSITTHLVAARLGTAKTNEAAKCSHRLRVVTPDWLWCCAERWERVDERLFPLTAETVTVRRDPPAHCSSPDPSASRSHSRQFQESMNPLLAFSPDDIARMDEEVEDIMQSESDDEVSGGAVPASSAQPSAKVTSSSVQLSRKRRAPGPDLDEEDEEEDMDSEEQEDDDDEDDEESPAVKFRRGQGLPSDDDDLGNDGNVESDESGPDLEENWSMMGAELERELGTD